MSDEENIKVLTQALTAFNDNDLEGVQRHVTPDIRYAVRGASTVSGSYEGIEAVSGVLRRIKELTAGTMAATPEVIMAEGDAIMAYMHVTGSRPDGRSYDNYQAYLYRFRDGRLFEGQTIPVDQAAFAAFIDD